MNLAKKVFYCNEKGENKIKFVRCGHFDTIKLDELIIKDFGEKDIYITKNAMRHSGTWKREELFTLFNIVIDLDCHDHHMDSERFMQASTLLVKMLGDEECEPNAIVFTGRGLQLWYSIEPVGYVNINAYKKMTNYLIKEVDKVLNKADSNYKAVCHSFVPQRRLDYETLACMQVDKGPTRNPAGLVRFPGSYNSKADIYGSFSLIHNRRINILSVNKANTFERQLLKIDEESLSIDLDEENKYLKENMYEEIQEIKYKAFNPYDTFEISDEYMYNNNCSQEIYHERERVFSQLISMRKGKWSEEGYRDLILHFLVSTYLAAGNTREEALEAAKKMNQKFENPLEWNEVISYMSTTFKKI